MGQGISSNNIIAFQVCDLRKINLNENELEWALPCILELMISYGSPVCDVIDFIFFYFFFLLCVFLSRSFFLEAKRSQSISNCVHLYEALPTAKSVPVLHTVSSLLPGISSTSCSHKLSGKAHTELPFTVFLFTACVYVCACLVSQLRSSHPDGV